MQQCLRIITLMYVRDGRLTRLTYVPRSSFERAGHRPSAVLGFTSTVRCGLSIDQQNKTYVPETHAKYKSGRKKRPKTSGYGFAVQNGRCQTVVSDL